MKTWNLKTLYRYAHIKRDGWQIVAIVGPNGSVQTFTKNSIEVDLSFLNAHACLARNANQGLVVHCELWKPNLPASSVKTAILANDTELRLDVFAVNGIGHGLPLAETALEVARWGLDFVPFYDRQNGPLSLGVFSDVRGLWDLCYDGKDRSIGVEGFVLKNGNMSEFVKWKPAKTADLKVVGIVPGTPGSKYEGQIGSLQCALRDGTVVCNAGTGLKDHHRWLDPNDLLGKIVEVKYDCVAGRGKLRFPAFVRFRDDKSEADETLS